MSRALRGLYAITPDALCADPARLLASVKAALNGGAVMVQYRDKSSAANQRLENARQLATLCKQRSVPLVINDDPELAAKAGADGVHLGMRDASIADARTRLGDAAIIGVTCGNDVNRALTAQSAGASYVSFGRFFESRTKPDAPAAEPGLLPRVREQIRIPICVIGGMTPANAGPLVAAGADLVAAAGGVFDATNIEWQARAFSALFTTI